ncbi:MAG TPA: hypothetical protein VFW38_07750 [Solirubrobacteraceae bacterium]|nr:hypothetical protein [Solirubrobacteraceae bacterium]
MSALIEPGANGLLASEHKDLRPCVVCGQPTKHRVGRRKSPTAWAWRSPRCADIAACTARRDAQRARARRPVR